MAPEELAHWALECPAGHLRSELGIAILSNLGQRDRAATEGQPALVAKASDGLQIWSRLVSAVAETIPNGR